jgi:hypothetical protein
VIGKAGIGEVSYWMNRIRSLAGDHQNERATLSSSSYTQSAAPFNSTVLAPRSVSRCSRPDSSSRR